MRKFNIIRSFITTFLLGCTFFSCNVYNQDIKGFLQKYTETAAIEKMEIAGTYTSNSEGITCLASGDDINLNFYLRNPQKYDLIFQYEFENDQTSGFSQAIPLAYENGIDKSSLKITLPRNFLLEVDKSNKDLSGKITIKEPISGRDFDNFPILLHANSVPPKVENACFQLDREIDGEYVICFFLPDVDSTSVSEMNKHKNDTRKIYFNDELRYFSNGKIYKNATCDDSGVWNFENEDTNFLTVAPALYPSETGYVFKSSGCPLGYSPVYYMTGIRQSTDKIPFSIKIIDDEGLSAVSEFSNQAKELSVPFISNIAELHNGVVVDEDTGLYEVVISHNGKTVEGDDCGEVNISYAVYSMDNPYDPIKKGTEKGSAKIKLPKGKYKVTANANKDYYIMSAVYSSESEAPFPKGIFLKSSSRIYVHQDGSDDNGFGSRLKPFRTIQKAVDFFNVGVGDDYTVDDVCEILLMSNITPVGDEEYYLNENALINLSSNFNYIISGYDGIKYKIDACGNSAMECRRVIYNQSEKQVILRNIIVSGGYLVETDKGAGYFDSSEGANVIFDDVEFTENICEKGAVAFNGTLQIDKAIVYDNKTSSGKQSNIYIAENKKIKITKDISTSKIGITTEKVPLTATDSVVFTNGYEYPTVNTLLPGAVFISDLPFGITYEDLTGEAIVAVSGGSAGLAIDKDVKINLIEPDYFEGSVETLIYQGDTVEFEVKKLTDTITDSCKISYKVKLLNKEISPSYYSINNTKLKFSNAIEPGVYTVKVTAVYGTGVNAVKTDTEYVFVIQQKDDLTLMSTVPASGSVLKISTLASLNKISEWVTSGNNLSGVTFVLDNDIVLDESFIPIGWVNEQNSKAFCGIFDGKGYSIDITNKNVNTNCLIVTAINASVKNVVITGCVSSVWTGMLDGISGTTIVENCINKAELNLPYGYAGAIVNWFDSGTVKNCKNYGDITFGDLGQVGGIVNIWRHGSIESCENYGKISSSENTVKIGGIVAQSMPGDSRACMRNCINYGTIDCPSCNSVGGLIGELAYDRDIENCANYGVIKASHTIGGLAGKIASGDSSRAQIYNCVSAGKIVVTSTYSSENKKYGTVAGYQDNTAANYAVDTGYLYHLSGIILNSSGETLPAETVNLRTPRDNVVSVAFSHSGSENRFYISQTIFDNSPTDDLITALNNYVRHYSGEGFREWVIGSKGFPVLKEAE